MEHNYLMEAFMNGNSLSTEYLDRVPVPVCVVDTEGGIKCANNLMKNVFTYEDIVDSNFFALTGVKRQDLLEIGQDEETDDEEKNTEIQIERNDQCFSLLTNTDPKENEDIIVYFVNVTEREELKINYKEERLCLLYVSIDNYDELISSITTDNKMAVPTEVDRCIRTWAEQYDAPIDNISDEAYTMTVFRKDADKMIESKFSILDEIRGIETKIDFPVSLSIGMGIGRSRLDETAELAKAAHELAMGRGGDQAVVKNGDRTHYYGGRLQSMEKNNKGKSRIIAHALKQLILESSQVIIMGHKWPDMDSFGAAIGAYKIASYLGKDTHIIIDDYNEALQVVYKQAHDTENYSFIDKEKARESCDANTLVIVVDTHRPNLVECPAILNVAEKVVVIDHHRLSEDAIENPTLSYVESYASSASELITEILQYTATKRIINKFEAETLLAGITVDTNSFSIRTGVRTFEASAWLRRAGADTTEVKRFFQTEVTSFQSKAEAIANAEYSEYGAAFTISEGYSTEAQIINAQVADELLMVKGVRASFAIGKNDEHTTVISARSLGDINVQVIMERFGGGGHLTSAGAQVEISPEEVLDKLKEILFDYVKSKDNEDE